MNVKLHVYARQETWDDGPKFTVFSFKDQEPSTFGSYIGEHSLEINLPEDWNPVAAEIAELEAQKLKALEEYQNTVSAINERLSRLTAIANEATA